MRGPLTLYREVSYLPMVLAADADFYTEANRTIEYEFSSPRGEPRIFKGWYKNRGPYASGGS